MVWKCEIRQILNWDPKSISWRTEDLLMKETFEEIKYPSSGDFCGRHSEREVLGDKMCQILRVCSSRPETAGFQYKKTIIRNVYSLPVSSKGHENVANISEGSHHIMTKRQSVVRLVDSLFITNEKNARADTDMSSKLVWNGKLNDEGSDEIGGRK